jgi:hypothetical protein
MQSSKRSRCGLCQLPHGETTGRIIVTWFASLPKSVLKGPEAASSQIHDWT